MRNRELSPTYRRRNKLLMAFFKKMGMDNITLLGDLRKPNIIWDDEYQLPMYVKNFDIYIKQGVYDQNHIAVICLDDIDDIDVDEFRNLLDTLDLEKVYRVMHGDLYYVGMKRGMGHNDFPVFSKQKPKIYYTTDKALEESNYLNSLGYDTNYV